MMMDSNSSFEYPKTVVKAGFTLWYVPFILAIQTKSFEFKKN
jgi:hypothetical protein